MRLIRATAVFAAMIGASLGVGSAPATPLSRGSQAASQADQQSLVVAVQHGRHGGGMRRGGGGRGMGMRHGGRHWGGGGGWHHRGYRRGYRGYGYGYGGGSCWRWRYGERVWVCGSGGG